jgi:putative ABC transport system substrate-binding protein
MKRREFITMVGAAGAAWPLVARAQQPAISMVGFLGSTSPEPSAHGPFVAALRQGLADAGFIEGRNVAIKSRGTYGDFDRLPMLAYPVNVIATVGGDVSAHAAKKATVTIPIVFTAGGDPVQSGRKPTSRSAEHAGGAVCLPANRDHSSAAISPRRAGRCRADGRGKASRGRRRFSQRDFRRARPRRCGRSSGS